MEKILKSEGKVKEIYQSEKVGTIVFSYCIKIFMLFRFSIWNTMMGTSVLSMPWALEQVYLLIHFKLYDITFKKKE